MRLLSNSCSRGITGCLAAILMVFAFGVSTQAQWQITEILYDSVDNNNWEWVEVLNTGTTAASLNEYILDDDDQTALGDANIFSTTVVPAGSVAILYDGGDVDDARFRAAWQLAESVPVISVSNWPGLSNGGDLVSLWASYADYDADLVEDPDTLVKSVGGTANAATAIDYSTDFPSAGDNSSVYWTGTPNSTDGANWLGSMLPDPPTGSPIDGAYASLQTNLPGGTPINSTDDIGNPGVIPGGTAPAKLMITEVMYNPDSDESTSGSWEWVEIYNNTGATINFSNAGTDYFLDDDDGSVLTEKNLANGIIEAGGVAILYDGDLQSEQGMKDAWGSDLNFISVPEWPGLANNNGELLGLWNNLADYSTDATADPRVTTNAEYGFVYDDDPNAEPPWPSDSPDGPSIYLTDLGLDPSAGDSWAASFDGDPIGSEFANPVIAGAVVDHEGGDVGSPGFIPFSLSEEVLGDYNNNAQVEQGDLDLVLLNWGDTWPPEVTGWVNQQPTEDQKIDQNDLDGVLLNWGNSASPAAAAVPEPTSLVLLLTLLAFFRRVRVSLCEW